MTQTRSAVGLREWAQEHDPAENLRFAQGFWSQVRFLDEQIHPLLVGDHRVRDRQPPLVVSEHSSKSVRLPVVRFVTPQLRLTCRNNFHDWKVSVDADRDVDDVFCGLFDPGRQIADVHCEGFARAWVHGPYAHDRRRFTVALAPQDGWMFTFCFLLAGALAR